METSPGAAHVGNVTQKSEHSEQHRILALPVHRVCCNGFTGELPADGLWWLLFYSSFLGFHSDGFGVYLPTGRTPSPLLPVFTRLYPTEALVHESCHLSKSAFRIAHLNPCGRSCDSLTRFLCQMKRKEEMGVGAGFSCRLHDDEGSRSKTRPEPPRLAGGGHSLPCTGDWEPGTA
ncbi:unnamed protein product [Boreogadus saida]